MTPSALESALAKLRARAAHEGPECYAPNAMLDTAEAAALLARLDAADKWDALMACQRVRVIGASMPEGDDYAHIGLELWTRFQFPEGCTDIEDRQLLERFTARAFAAYRNPAPAAEGEHADWCPVCGGKDGQHLHGCEDGSEVL